MESTTHGIVTATNTHATPERSVLGHATRYMSVMCSDGARRTAYLVSLHADAALRREITASIAENYGQYTANAAVYVYVYDQGEGEHYEVFGNLVWNGESDAADAIFYPFSRTDFDNPYCLLPSVFVWGAARDFVGPFPSGWQPKGWENIIIPKWGAA